MHKITYSTIDQLEIKDSFYLDRYRFLNSTNSSSQVTPLEYDHSAIQFVSNYFELLNQGYTPLVLNYNLAADIKKQLIARYQNQQVQQGHYLATSGTTGGKIKSFHFSLDKALGNASAHYQQISSPVKNILFPLAHGHSFGVVVGILGPIVLADQDDVHTYFLNQIPKTDELLQTIRKFNIDTLYLVPSLARMLLKDKELITAVSSLKTISIGAAPFYQDELLELMELFPQVEFYTTYGLTEMGPRVTTFKAGNCKNPNPSLQSTHQVVPLGSALDGVQLKVDQTLRIKSSYCADDFTNEFFNTGDVVEYCGTEICFSARSSHIINVGGKKLYPDIIESQFYHYSTIKACALIGIEDSMHGELPVLVVEVTTDFSFTDFIGWMKKNVIHAHWPTKFYQVDTLPVTSLGKVKKRVVAEMVKQGKGQELVRQHQYIKLDDQTQKLANIWQQVLGSEVGVKSDFFLLGGSSLLAVDLISRINKRFAVNLTLQDLIQNSELGQLSELITNGHKDQYRYLVELKNNGARRNIYFFHAIGGNVLNYLPFTNFSDDYNFWGIHAEGVNGFNLHYESIDSMAQKYVAEIIKQNSDGPYILAGGSFGGMLAYATGCLLRDMGKDVEEVVLFDTSCDFRINKFTSHISRWLKSPKIYGYCLINFLYHIFKRPTPFRVRNFLMEHFHLLARMNYTPRSLDRPLYLIRAEISENSSEEDLGWHKMVRSRIDLSYVDANHDEFMEHPEVRSYFAQYLT